MTLAAEIQARLDAALVGIGESDARVQAAGDTRFGDYQTNVAMTLAKSQRTNPRQLAQRIIDCLDVADLCEPPEIAGAGFINFRLRPEALAQRFATLAADTRLGVPKPALARKFVIDFSSPNVAKPMHIGHIRSTILGDALARIAAFIGHTVVRDNHIGDWGKQFGMLLVGWKRVVAGGGSEPQTIEALEQIYRFINSEIQKELSEVIKAPDGLSGESALEKEVRNELVKLQSGEPENLALWRKMIAVSRSQFDQIYERLGVNFDYTLGESFYNPWLKDIVLQLRDAGIARESEGALCVFSDGSLPEKDDPFLISRDGHWVPMPSLVQKADGAANYTTTDLATLDYRLREFAPDEILYVTDGRQQHHFRQLFAIFRRWHPEASVRLAHVWFGSILGENGKPFATRSGETVKLSDLLDEARERAFNIVTEKNSALPEPVRLEIARVIGIGAVKYADLLPNRQSDYTFSWDKMLALTGNTAPYLQYSCVRIQSIFRKAEHDPGTQPSAVTLHEPAELALTKKLFQFGEVLPQVLEDYRPNLLCNYLYELAGAFHSFFEACPVLKAGDDLRASRLTLCAVTARILREGLGLLGIGVPERM